MDNLTKENFWDNMYKKYPITMQKFCKWIDEYKRESNWDKLFQHEIKFHHLPINMQYGIVVRFIMETIRNEKQPDDSIITLKNMFELDFKEIENKNKNVN